MKIIITLIILFFSISLIFAQQADDVIGKYRLHNNQTFSGNKLS